MIIRIARALVGVFIVSVFSLISACEDPANPSDQSGPAIYNVSASGTNVAISPGGVQTATEGASRAFTVTADSGYTLSPVGGTCAPGQWSGSVYLTGPITADCTVTFYATNNSYAVTVNAANVAVSPMGVQTVKQGCTQAFTVNPNTGYALSPVGGTCASGQWSGSVYTTGPITANCTVNFSAAIISYSVAASGNNVAISPSTVQTVNNGSSQTFIVTPNTGYTLSPVGGTCAPGQWSGSAYTTGAITADCSVTFNAAINSYLVSASGANLSVSPTSASVNYGGTQAFTYKVSSGYSASKIVSGSCPSGSWVGNVYTTGPVVANCSVAFESTLTAPLAQSAQVFSLAGISSAVKDTNGNLYAAAGASLVKFDSNGNVLWTRSVSGAQGAALAALNSVAIDGSGNLYVAGSIGTGIYSLGNGVSVAGICAGSSGLPGNNVLLAKYNSSGVAQWAQTFTPDSNLCNENSFNALAVDSSGNAYAAGPVSAGNYALGNGITLNQMNGGVLVKYDSAGAAQWVTASPVSTWEPYLTFASLAVASNNNVVAGIDFDELFQPVGGVYEYNSAGTATMNWPFSPTVQENQNWGGSVFINTITVDASGNLYVAGNGFVAKYGPSACSPLWLLQFSVTASVSSLVVDNMGTVYLAGFSQYALNLGNGVSANGSDNQFLAAINSAGVAQWAQPIVTTLSDEDVYYPSGFTSLILDSSGGLYGFGEVPSNATSHFGNQVSATCSSNNSCGLFVKYH